MLMGAFRVYEVLVLNTFDDADEGAQKQLPIVTHVDADSFFTQLSTTNFGARKTAREAAGTSRGRRESRLMLLTFS